MFPERYPPNVRLPYNQVLISSWGDGLSGGEEGDLLEMPSNKISASMNNW